jgi:hypothetical protein
MRFCPPLELAAWARNYVGDEEGGSWLLRSPETPLTKERNDDDHKPYAAVYRTGDADGVALGV